MSKADKSDVISNKKIGGISFFLSLFFLIVLTIGNLFILPSLLNIDSIVRWTFFVCGVTVGLLLATFVIGGHFAVFLHELKHAIVSNLAGNRAKGMLVRNDHGYFQYSYSERTAHMNALISLAPYFFPGVTIPFFLIGVLIFSSIPAVPLVLAGIGYGIDTRLAIKDLGPWQSDLTNIRGGYPVGLLYIIAMNGAIFSFLAAWICGGWEALPVLLDGFFTLLEKIFRVAPPG